MRSIGARRIGAVFVVAFAWMGASAAIAAECPGNPDALGTSRVLVVDPTEHSRLGTMQYRETLPLEPGEVVLTFDDGPLPPYSNRVLDTLAAHCVKATYFLVGRMAQAYPDMVRRIHAAGHTVGTHSQSHPLTFHKMPLDKAQQEIEGGISSVKTALGADEKLAPFFRIPGLLRADQVEAYLAGRAIMTWSADFPADDWRRVPASEIVRRAVSRLEAKGKGVLLLHDIQPATVLALPDLLRELKQRGYRIVHVVPASADRPKTATLPSQWLMNPGKDPIIDVWPRTIAALPDGAAQSRLVAPGAQVLGIGQPGAIEAMIASPIEQRTGKARARRIGVSALWPRRAPTPSILDLVAREELPVPNPESFGYSNIPARHAAPQRRAALTPSPAVAEELRGAVAETAAPETTGSIVRRPGGWPVTTANMPKAGFP